MLHEDPAGHMQFNACWYIGGIVDKLKNVFIVQQETLDQDLEAFHAQFYGPRAGKAPWRSCAHCGRSKKSHHLPMLSNSTIQVLSVILRAEYEAINAVMAMSQNKRNVSYQHEW